MFTDLKKLPKDHGAYVAIGAVGLVALAGLVSQGTGYPKGSAKQTKWGTKSHALSKKKRASLSAKDFALPKQRKYPINDKEHGRLALTYATWSKTSRKDLPEVKRAVFARYPSLRRWWNNSDYVKAHPKQRVQIRRAA